MRNPDAEIMFISDYDRRHKRVSVRRISADGSTVVHTTVKASAYLRETDLKRYDRYFLDWCHSNGFPAYISDSSVIDPATQHLLDRALSSRPAVTLYPSRRR